MDQFSVVCKPPPSHGMDVHWVAARRWKLYHQPDAYVLQHLVNLDYTRGMADLEPDHQEGRNDSNKKSHNVIMARSCGCDSCLGSSQTIQMLFITLYLLSPEGQL